MAVSQSDLIIEASDFFLVCNLNLHIYINEDTIRQMESIGLRVERLSKSENKRGVPFLSELFTLHFKNDHFPIAIQLPGKNVAKIDLKHLREIAPEFKDLVLKNEDEFTISWKIIATSNGQGTISFHYQTTEPLPYHIHRKLDQIYLKYPIISTAGLGQLFRHEYNPLVKNDVESSLSIEDECNPVDIPVFRNSTERVPEYISIERMVEQIDIELNYRIKRFLFQAWNQQQRERYLVVPSPYWHRFRSLNVETITPIINITVDNHGLTQRKWRELHKREIANYVMHPQIFELGELSDQFIDKITDESTRIWSISEHSSVYCDYHGILRVHFNSEKTVIHPISGFYMDTLESFFYSALISIQNYYSLRIMDHYLDTVTSELFNEGSVNQTKEKATLILLKFIPEITHKLQFQLEELANIDKLIDSQPHIELANLVGVQFGVNSWYNMVVKKLETIDKLSKNVDYAHEWILLEDTTIIDSSNFFLTANINLRINLNAETMNRLSKVGFIVEELSNKREQIDNFTPYISELFTVHFKETHNPISISLRDLTKTGTNLGQDFAVIDLDELKRLANEKGSGFFDDLKLNEPLILRWRNMISSNGMGTIIFEYQTSTPLPQRIHRKLSLIYLKWKIIPTEGLEYLFQHEYIDYSARKNLKYRFSPLSVKGDDVFREYTPSSKKHPIPKYVSIDELFERYEAEIVYKIKREIVEKFTSEECSKLLVLPSPSWDHFKPLAIETITPIIVLNVNPGKDFSGQMEWINQHRKLIAQYIAKPELYEMRELSEHYIKNLTDLSKLWTISGESFMFGNYHGLLRIKLSGERMEAYPHEEFSGFWMETTNTFLYSVLTGIQNYYNLRIFDGYLDKITDQLFMHDYEPELDSLDILERIHDVIHKIQNQLEEISNIDKLIGSDPHIALVTQVNKIFELDKWAQMVMEKIKSIDGYAQMLDYINDNKSQKKTENMLFAIAIFEFIFGFIQAFTSLLSL